MTLKASLFTAGAVFATVSMGAGIAFQASSTAPASVNLGANSEFCVTAELEEDPSIFAQRGNCGPGESEPGIEVPEDETEILDVCTPTVREAIRLEAGKYTDPRYPTYQEYLRGNISWNDPSVTEWSDNPPPSIPVSSMSAEDELTYADALAHFGKKQEEIAQSYPWDYWGVFNDEMLPRMPEIAQTSMDEFCSSYAGPVLPLYETPRYIQQGDPELHGLSGSTEPIVLSYKFTIDNPYTPKKTKYAEKDFVFTKVNNVESIPGFASLKSDKKVVDGETIFTETIIPGPEGWGSSDEMYNMSITVDRNKTTGTSTPQTINAKIRVNNSTLQITPPGPSNPVGSYYNEMSPGFLQHGASWDNHITHVGHYTPSSSGLIDQESGKILNFSLKRGDNDMEPQHYNSYTAILENSKTTLYTDASYRNGIGNVNFNGSKEPGPFSSKIKVKVVDPNTFATALHTFTHSVVDAPKNDTSRKYTITDLGPDEWQGHNSVQQVTLDDGYSRFDYETELSYNGETCHAAVMSSCSISQDLPNGGSVYIGHSPAHNMYPLDEKRATRQIVFRGDETAPNEVELKFIYKPTGDVTTVKVKLR